MHGQGAEDRLVWTYFLILFAWRQEELEVISWLLDKSRLTLRCHLLLNDAIDEAVGV